MRRSERQVAIVTGGASGIGEVTANCLTLPPRTVIEEIVTSTTIMPDQTRELEGARRAGAPVGEERHGFAGAVRALGSIGGRFRAPMQWGSG